jgi:hypothetical protein
MVEYEHRRKKQRKGRSSGCRLQVGGVENDLLAIRLQNPMTLFSAARPYEQFKVSKKQRGLI